MPVRFKRTIALPASFRPGDILAFHRRDAQELAERVSGTALQKGLLWGATPACLSLRFAAATAEAELTIDGDASSASEADFERMLHRMLGLTQDVETFESCHRGHAQLGPLISRQPGLRVPLTATPFEALTWAVTGQQISVGAAVSLRRRLIMAAGLRHSSGLLCYPDASQLASLTVDALRQAGFSMSKAHTLLCLSQQVAAGGLPLAEWQMGIPASEIREALLAVRGVGPWTIDYALLRGFGWLDGSLHGDAAVRRKLQALLASPEKLGPQQARDWLAQFSPWRALVAAHLWAMHA